MLRIHASLLVAFIVVAISVAILTRPRATHPESLSGLEGETVLNAPYSAELHFISVLRSADGTTYRTETHLSEARDSRGRTYSADERLWIYFGER
jgi:hypothetical protein